MTINNSSFEYKKTTRFEAAKLYTQRKWVIHPLYSPEAQVTAPGKQPVLKEWQHRGVATEEELQDWFGAHDYNLGLVAGKKSNVLVIDRDHDLFWSLLVAGIPLDTLQSFRIEGRGHVFFTYTDEFPSQKHHMLGIEILSNASNVVLPPSRHKEGQIYRWVDHNATVSPMPDELKSRLQELFKGEKNLMSALADVRPCFKRLWNNGDPQPLHGGEGREAMAAFMLELKARGCGLTEIKILARLIYKNEYDSEKTATEFKNWKGKPWTCKRIRERLSSIISCDGCELEKRRGEKGKGVEPKKEFILLDEVENALTEAQTPKYHGPINFDPEIGIFFRVPINTPTPLMQPIIFTPSEGFAHKTENPNGSENIKEDIAHENGINVIFAHDYRLIEGVPLYLSSNQRVQILRVYLTLLKTNEKVCKIMRGEIVVNAAIKTISYFKYNSTIEPYLIACWSIGTYLFPMFPVFPYLIFVGEKGTNKSGHLVYLSRICWNPTSKLSLPNEAPLFRMIEQGKPTQLIDEAHRQINHPIYGLTLQQLLESGHERGGKVPRCDENNRDRINFYDVYCPKALASRETLELEEKGITIVLSKSYDRKYAIARKILDTDPELDVIQENLLLFALAKWRKIKEVYDHLEPTDRLAGRYFILWAPILAICKVAYPDKFAELLQYAEEAVTGVEKKSYEVEIRVLSFLVSRIDKIKNQGNAVLLKDLTEVLNLKWQPIFSALRNLGLIKTDRDTLQGKKYYLHIDKIKQLADERGITIEETEDDDEGFGETSTAQGDAKYEETEDDDEGFWGQSNRAKCEICGKAAELKEAIFGNRRLMVCSDCWIEDGGLIGEEPNPEQPEQNETKKEVEETITPIEIRKNICTEKGECQNCHAGEKWGVDLPYIIHYSNHYFKTVCKECGEKIIRDYNLTILHKQPEQLKYRCKQCGFKSNDLNEYNRHEYDKHPVIPNGETREYFYELTRGGD
jgi:predicted RNA-binding Zn-ribbon protein involved in translation (DUF1610 family)